MGRNDRYPSIENPSTKIFWKDLHEEPGLKMCSLAAQGLWTHHMLAIMAGAGGYLALLGNPLSVGELASYIGKPFDQVEMAFAELQKYHVFSIDRRGTVYNRRLVRGQIRVTSSRLNGQKGGRPKSLETRDYSKSKTQIETQTKPNHKPRSPPTRAPLSNLSQDSQIFQEESLSMIKENSSASRHSCRSPNFSSSDLLPAQPDEIIMAVAAWNELAAAHALAHVEKITQPRRQGLTARLKECGGIDGWRETLALIPQSPFLLGENDRGWRADFDFVLIPRRFTKLREGGYQSGPGIAVDQGDRVMDAIRAAALEADRRDAEAAEPPLKLINGGNHG